MLTFMENQPLLWHLKAWWTEEQMDEWINKQTEEIWILWIHDGPVSLTWVAVESKAIVL